MRKVMVKKFIPKFYFVCCLDCGTLVKKYSRKETVSETIVCKKCRGIIEVHLNKTFNCHNGNKFWSKLINKNQVVICNCLFTELGVK